MAYEYTQNPGELAAWLGGAVDVRGVRKETTLPSHERNNVGARFGQQTN
jgi:hypothetical protein